MKSTRTKTISSRLSEKEAQTIQNICDELNDTPSRIFRNLLLAWMKRNKGKIENNC